MLLFTEGFETDSNPNVKWSGGSLGAPQTAWGRNGTYGWWGWDGGRRAWKDIAPKQTLIAGIAAQLKNPTQADDVPLLSFMDGGSAQVDLRYNSSGALRVVRGNGAAVLNSYTVPGGHSATWKYVEFKATIHGSTGSYEVRLNGATVMSGTGVVTQHTGNAYANRFHVGTYDNNYYDRYHDDIYLCDDQGTHNNDFLGDVQIRAYYPNGNGNSSQWDGSDGNQTDNYALVDEAQPNDDTDYVSAGDAGEKDTYTFGNMSETNGSILGVLVQPYAKEAVAEGTEIVAVARLSGTEQDSDPMAMTIAYAHYQGIFEEKPGGGQWTITDLNNAEFGVKIV